MTFAIDETLEIAAPPEKVWEVLTDFSAYKEWNPFVVQARCELTPGGAIDMQVQLKNKPQHQVEHIIAVTPGQGFSYCMKPMPLGALRSFRSHSIEAAGPGRSRYTSHFELHGWLRPLVLALYRQALEKGFAGMTAAIARRAEDLTKRS
jgi:uncharacterized protein YndB with AHSA1/START domain